MKIARRTFRQFLIVTGLMTLGLLLVNSLGANVAMAQVIDPGTDQPALISLLTGGQTGIRALVLAIINFFLTFLGLLAVVMVIYGGFLYVGSAGNEENVNKAKKILMYAVIGIIIIIVSFALVNAILGAASPERQ